MKGVSFGAEGLLMLHQSCLHYLRVDMNPGWEYKLWDRSDAQALLEKYPQYKNTYAILPRDVERADLLR